MSLRFDQNDGQVSPTKNKRNELAQQAMLERSGTPYNPNQMRSQIPKDTIMDQTIASQHDVSQILNA